MNFAQIRKVAGSKKQLLVGAAFGVIGVATIISTYAAIRPNAKATEAESAVNPTSATVVGDANASAGNFLQFNAAATPTPPVSGTQPTRANTGPRFAMTNITADEFFSTRTCNRQRIVGDLRFEQQWMKGQTFTLTDCEITGLLWIYIDSGRVLSIPEMPVINMDYVDVMGGWVTLNAANMNINHSYIDGGTQLSLDDVWAPFVSGPAPYTISNSVFYGYYKTQPEHAEPLHVGDYGSGYRFTNVAFLQQSGSTNNSGITAAINFHGMDTIFDGCYFIWDGGSAPAFTTAYLDAGGGSIVRNSKFATSGAYIYYGDPPGTGVMHPTYQNNTNYDTGQPISLP